MMRHDPPADFKKALVAILTDEGEVADEEAARIATTVTDAYLTVEDVSGSVHFYLLNVALRWQALCGAVAEGKIAFSDSHFAGLLLVGVLRWFDSMRYYHQFNAPRASRPAREALFLDHIEAAACMALWHQAAEAQPHSPDDTSEALLGRANAVLREAGLDSIDKPRLQEAMERLQTLGCLTPRDGFLRLRDEVKYQVPEE